MPTPHADFGIPFEIKAIPTEFKVDAENRIVKGYASTFGNVDLGNDVVHAGAFQKTIEERQPQNLVKFLWQHDRKMPLGRIERLEEDSKGLYFEAYVSKTSYGDDCLTLLADRAVDRTSIGFWASHYEIDENDTDENGWPRRHIHEVDPLLEISPVTFAMNEEAVVTGVKRAEFIYHPETGLLIPRTTFNDEPIVDASEKSAQAMRAEP
jgi:HK97 family phage prohead protease